MYKGALLHVWELAAVCGAAAQVPREGSQGGLPRVFEEVVTSYEGYAIPVSLKIDGVEIGCEIDPENTGTVMCQAEIGGETVTTCIDVFGEQRCLDDENSLGLGDYVYQYGFKYLPTLEYRAMSLREFPARDPMSGVLMIPEFRQILGDDITYLSSSAHISDSRSDNQAGVECAAISTQARFLVQDIDFNPGFMPTTLTFTRHITCSMGELPSCDSECNVMWDDGEGILTMNNVTSTRRIWREDAGLCVTGYDDSSVDANHYLPDFLWGGGQTPCLTTILEDATRLSESNDDVLGWLGTVVAVATVAVAVAFAGLIYCCKFLPPSTLWVVVLCCDAGECVAVVSLWIAAGRCRSDLYCPESFILPTRIVAVADLVSVLLEIAAAVISFRLGDGSKRPRETANIGLGKLFRKRADDDQGFLSLGKRIFLVCGVLPTVAYFAAFISSGGFSRNDFATYFIFLSISVFTILAIVATNAKKCHNRGSCQEFTKATVTSLVVSEVLSTGGLLTVAAQFGSIVGWGVALRVLATAFELL